MTAATIATGIRLNESSGDGGGGGRTSTTFLEPMAASNDSTIYLNAVSVNKSDVMLANVASHRAAAGGGGGGGGGNIQQQQLRRQQQRSATPTTTTVSSRLAVENSAITSYRYHHHRLSDDDDDDDQERLMVPLPTIIRKEINHSLLFGSGTNTTPPVGHHHEQQRSLGLSKKQRTAKKEYHRLRKRKALFKKKCKITDISLCFALFGLFLMIAEYELTMAGMYTKDDTFSLIMKASITISTIFLLVLVTAYHALEVQLFMVDNGVEDWQIAVSGDRAMKFCIEFAICSIHPMPFTHYVTFLMPAESKSEEFSHHNHKHAISLDLFLSLPMFMRLYLISRVMLLHSRMFTDASSRSIGALNRIDINSRFVVKALMTICPGTVIITFVLTLFMIASWTVRACELTHDPDRHSNILHSMWLISVTFLAVGYGDVVPQTYCGRAICVVSAMMGVSCTATMVAVLTRKLELTRAEKHVHNFVMDSQLSKRLRESAAIVLQETWRIYRLTKLSNGAKAGDVRHHQKRFLKAVYRLRRLKIEQGQLNDSANSMADLSRAVVSISDNLIQLKNQQANLQEDMRRLAEVLRQIVPSKVCTQHSIQSNLDLLAQHSKDSTSTVLLPEGEGCKS